MKYFITGLFVLFLSIVQAQLPNVCEGKLQRHENFASKFVTPRNIDVWLPLDILPTKDMLCYICTMGKCYSTVI
jgi:hypothetical protein